MRKYIGVLVCAACVMLVSPRAAVPEGRDGPETVAALTLRHVQPPAMSEELRMILAGTALLGMAYLVRRAP